MGAEYIILGHSENRAEGETPQLIKKKVASSLNQKLTGLHLFDRYESNSKL